MPEGMNIEVDHKLSEQGFRLRSVRMGAMGLAVGLLVYGLVTAASLPRL